MADKKKNYTKEKKQLLDSLINQSKKKGYIHESTITAKFSRYAPTDPEMENIFAAFESEGIEVIFSDEDDDFMQIFEGGAATVVHSIFLMPMNAKGEF